MTLPDIGLDFMPGASPYTVAGETYLSLTGATNSRASTPDHASFAITDLDVRILLAIDQWPTPGNVFEVIGQFNVSAQRAWLLYIAANRRLWLRWSTNGTIETDVSSTTAIVPGARGIIALRVTHDVNNGAGGKTTTFYTSDSLAGPWTTLGSPTTTAGTTSIHNSTGTLGIGDVPASGFSPFPGRVFAADWRAGINSGTAVANPDFTVQTPGASSFADAAGRTWTVTSPATIAGFDWEPIPTIGDDNRCRAMSLNYDIGRTSELDKFPPSRLNTVLRNHDRVLDPEHETGPYFGDLNPRVPVRLQLDVGSGMVDQFYGFVETGWRQTYQKPVSVRCELDLVDLLGILEAEAFAGTAYDTEVLADEPVAYWRLDEDSGTQMADSSGNGNHGFRDNGESVDPLVYGGGKAFSAPHVGDNRGRFVGESLPDGPPCSIEAWFKVPRDLTQLHVIANVQRDASFGTSLTVSVETSASGSPNGEVVVDFRGIGGGYKFRGGTRVDDDRVHQVVLTVNGAAASDVVLYVDGEAETKTTISGTTAGDWPGLYWWTVANIWDSSSGDYGLGGVIDEVAIYDRVLDPEQIATHYEAGTTAFTGDTTGARINRVLDLLGLPEALRDIADGDTTLGPADYGTGSVGGYLARVVESEQGHLYVAHHNGGKLTFRGRYTRLTETRSTVSQATFTDDPDDGQYHYRNDITPEPNSIETVINTVDVTWQGGTETVVDEASRALYGSQSRSIATEASTASAARSAGAWLTARYGQPQSRIRQLPLAPGGRQTGLPAVVTDLRVSDRVTVRRHPNQIGDPVVNGLIVEGVHTEMHADQSWYASATTSNADDAMVWIWNVSEWGLTTVWG